MSKLTTTQPIDHRHPFAVALTGALNDRNQCAADKGLVSKGLVPTKPFPKGRRCWCGMHEGEEP